MPKREEIAGEECASDTPADETLRRPADDGAEAHVRRSDRLSSAAVGGIIGSCIKAEQTGHAMQTFGTATFGRRREDFQTGEASIGGAMRRFLDNWNRDRRRRGEDLLRYVWVAENPWSKRTEGERNPHAHFLVDWACDKKQFRGMAERVENWWGLGTVKLEVIRESAPGYLLKGAGYMGKGQFPDQGPVRGNRWGRSLDIIPEIVERIELELPPEVEAALSMLRGEAAQRGGRISTGHGWMSKYGLTIPSPYGMKGLRSDLRTMEGMTRLDLWF